MTALNWLRSGRPPSGAPQRRPRHGGRTWVLVVLALAGLSATGCQSSPCGGGCGNPFSGLTNWWSTASFRPFHHKKACSTCGGGEAPVVEYGTPVVGPGPVAVPAPGVITPGPSSTVPPATGSGPSQLEPAPSAVPGPASGDTGAKNSTGKANYEAYRSNYRSARSQPDSIARGEVPVLEPAPGPRTSARVPAKVASSNPLDNLPPVDIPSVDDSADGRTSQSPPPAPAAVRENPPSAVPAPAETRSEAASAASAPAPVSIAPGIKRFSVVDSKLAGGSFPTAAGLDWLSEKGYKTFLDLRDPSEVQAASISLITTHGLRYVALPITDKTLDSDHVARFNLELALAEARPLYFCDTNGSRAGALWYIRRLTQDKIDPQVASREAEALGLTDKALWQAASRYLETLKKQDPGAPQAAVPATENPPAPPSDSPSAAAPTALASSTEADTPEQDPTAWGSAAALMVTGLGIPLAYWSASSFPSFRGLTRASLPAPGRRPKSLPSASDA